MADLYYAHETLGRAEQVLATHPGRIKERLIAAFNDSAIPMVSGQIVVPTNAGQTISLATGEARRIWQTCVWEPLTRVKDRDRGAAAASLDDASEEEACAIAQDILIVAAMVQMAVVHMGPHVPRE